KREIVRQIVRDIVMVKVADLRPHANNKYFYGTPTANSAYKDIKLNMKRIGFDPRWPLFITEDRRILSGVTRWACAKSEGIEAVPCEVFEPSSPETAEIEYEREIVLANMHRQKSQLSIAREQRSFLESEKALARTRMAVGSDGGASKATDRVGKVFGESGKTVQRRLKILEGIEEAQAEGNSKRADRLIDLLE